MAARKISSGPREVYQLKITLRGSRPPIWRRLLVSCDSTFEELHAIIQTAMGWSDSHMHMFEIGRLRIGASGPFGVATGIDESVTSLHSVLGKKGTKANYTYDFGDGWEHLIVVEKVLPMEDAADYPLLIDGKRHCPPEDCGGVGGYENLLDTISNPEDEDHEEMLEWLGEGFDPEDFSVEEVNEELAPFRHAFRKRAPTSAASAATGTTGYASL